MDLSFTWKESKGQYSSGESLYLNRIQVGSYGWNSNRPKGNTPDETNYAGNILLPSLKNHRVFAGTREEVKVKMEKVATNWFSEATGK